jgi:hypothetical protein
MTDLIRSFRLEVNQSDLDDLKARLLQTRFPDQETVPDTSQGPQRARLKALISHWADGMATTGGPAKPCSTVGANTRPRSTVSGSTSCISARPSPVLCR